MKAIVDQQELQRRVRIGLIKQLRWSGLLEYTCPTPQCRTQVFSTWAVELTCNRCGKALLSRYKLEKSWQDA